MCVLADLEDGKVLLAQLCAALAGYQRLCPDIFLQINLNPAKLLPPLPKSGCCKDGLPCSEVLQGTLELMENSSDSRTKVGGTEHFITCPCSSSIDQSPSS